MFLEQNHVQEATGASQQVTANALDVVPGQNSLFRWVLHVAINE